MLTVYGRKSSANVQKVHWICAEGDIDFQSVNVGGKYGGHDSLEFKQMNPNSTIPVLKDGDFIIYESNSIIKYISAKFNIFKSYNNQSTALTNQWIDWSSLVFGLHCATYTAHTMLLPLEKRNRILASETQKKIYASFEILDKQLHKHQFLLDNDFSLADIPVGCWLHRCVVLDLGFSEYKLLEELYLRFKKRSAFQKAVIAAPLPPN